MRLSILIILILVTNLYSNEMEILKEKIFIGNNLQIREKLKNGTNFEQFIASYKSEGLNINGLLTIPLEKMPPAGYPAILFIHGYIPPKQYSTIKSYSTYQKQLANAGFITFKPDLRGHGESEGEPVRAHFSEKYVIDTMYALASIEMFNKTDPAKLFYWGHSNGGEIGLRVIILTNKIKAASFWAGVVGSYEDMLETYNHQIPFLKNPKTSLIEENGLPSKNPDFWKKIDPYYYLELINTPVLLHHGTNDKSVPIELSIRLSNELITRSKNVTFYTYEGDNHNISNNKITAFQRDIDFFKSFITTKPTF